MKKSYTKNELLTILKGHEKHITNVRNWNQYSKDNALPHSQTLISHFGSWNALKKELSLELNDYLKIPLQDDKVVNKTNSKMELLTLLKGNEEHITSVNKWNEYSKDNALPHSQTIISYFGSWNGFKKELLDLKDDLKVGRPEKYSDNELHIILDEYKTHYTSVGDWDMFAETQQLPKHFVFMNRLGPDIIREKTGLITSWSTEEIKKIIKYYFPTKPPTQTEWMELAKMKRVPGKSTIIRKFNSWSQMKFEVYYKE